LIEILKNLSEIFGPSGKEDRVRDYLKKLLESHVEEVEEDFLGNLYMRKGTGRPEVLLCAHMDEVGFIIKGITEDGFLKFTPVGGIDPEILPGKKVVFENGKNGVIGYKPFHLQKKEERGKKISFNDLVIDAGMHDRKEAERNFSPGDYAVFDTSFKESGKRFIKGKAFDDRVGCAIIAEILRNFDFEFKVTALFSVQEELGLRGAKIGGERVKPDISLIIEGTAAGDFYQRDGKDFPFLGKGPVLTVLDRSCVVDKELLNYLGEISKKNKIPYQYKKPLIGGTDAGMIQLSGEGVRVGIISVPIRYIHSPVSLAENKDVRMTFSLAFNFLKEVKRIWKRF